MDSFGALALATEPPTEALLERPPKNVAHKKQSLLSPEMYKMILGQSLYQTVVLLGGVVALPYYKQDGVQVLSQLEINSIIFNSFIMCQLFNLIACRKINPKEYNIFAGLHKNFVFLLILLLEAVVQFFLVGFTIGKENDDGSPERILFFLDWIGVIFETAPLNIWAWLFCIGIGFVGFIWGIILRFIPVPAEKNYKGDLDEDDEEGEKQSLLVNSK